jgi:hypothetical protein
VAHGFFAALMAHVILDMVLFCTDRRIVFRPSRLLLSLYHLIFLGVFASLFFGMRNRSLLDIDSVENLAPDWTSVDYLYLVGLLTGAVSFLLEVLHYDLERANGKEFLINLSWYGFFLILSFPLILGMESLFPGHFVIKVVGISILVTFLEKTNSGSGVARLFWKSLLITSMVVVVVQVADRGTALFLLLPYLLHQLGERAMMLYYGSGFRPHFLDLYTYAIIGLPFRKAIFIIKTYKKAIKTSDQCSKSLK